jgi:hypothetical protein
MPVSTIGRKSVFARLVGLSAEMRDSSIAALESLAPAILKGKLPKFSSLRPQGCPYRAISKGVSRGAYGGGVGGACGLESSAYASGLGGAGVARGEEGLRVEK